MRTEMQVRRDAGEPDGTVSNEKVTEEDDEVSRGRGIAWVVGVPVRSPSDREINDDGLRRETICRSLRVLDGGRPAVHQ
jgi:hypothetical protein